MKQIAVRGINILNPVGVDREYYLNAIDYAIHNGYNHIQINGPIHDPVLSNIDGMTFFRKYACFNNEKDSEYVLHCMNVVNECLEKSHSAGIKTYMWHHELELPCGFNKAFPDILNEYGDVEISHPIIKDFLENKIADFFHTYPLMDGIVLTYVETKIPLMRLKKQNLSSGEIMTYITGILYNFCKSLGKELIVRTFASVEKDYRMLLDAYERVNTDDLIIMDKWTQYDWSLTLPANSFLRNIKKNPLIIETDLFGEFFGKGRLPLMLRDHIQKRFSFCEQHDPIGYCSRIDRGRSSAFGTVNEVNLHIMKAVLNGYDIEETISHFFEENYGLGGKAVKAVMEKTEGIVRKMLFANGYYYSELSWFPTLNHCKNHFYFELMREDYHIASNEWFIPVGYTRGSVQHIFNDLESAQSEATSALAEIEALKELLESDKYEQLYIYFKNLVLSARCWLELAKVFYHYTRYFDEHNPEHKESMALALNRLEALDLEGKSVLGNKFYCNFRDVHAQCQHGENILEFISEVRASFASEDKAVAALQAQRLTDFIVCGGGSEGHMLQKEVNFSDTLLIDGELARIPGNRAGMEWSTITAHGWFSYEVKMRQGVKNTISIVAGSSTETLKAKVTIGSQEYVIDQPCTGKQTIDLNYMAAQSETATRIKVDKISDNMPLIYQIIVY